MAVSLCRGAAPFNIAMELSLDPGTEPGYARTRIRFQLGLALLLSSFGSDGIELLAIQGEVDKPNGHV